jgi:hypothetical protein
MFKSFKEYLNESDSKSFSMSVFDNAANTSTEHLNNADDVEEKEAALQGYAHLVGYLYGTNPLPEAPTMELLEHVLFLGSVSSCYECEVLMKVAFPKLIGEYGSINVPHKEIWEDEYWANSPGSNSIDAVEYKGVRMCFWQDSGDGPYIYIKDVDLLKIMQKNPEALRMFPDTEEVLSDSEVDIQPILHKYRGQIGSNKYGL